MTGMAWARAAMSRCTWTANKWARAGSSGPYRWRSRLTRLATSAEKPGLPVSPDYGPEDNAFSGEVNWVQIDLEKEDQDHLITAEERFRVAMAVQ